jgi:hypothetical protein
MEALENENSWASKVKQIETIFFLAKTIASQWCHMG